MNGCERVSDHTNLVLTGFMASGKSTVGRLVADRLGREFIDTDAVIEARTGKRISDIFAEEGEAAFRRLEKELCRELSAPRRLVIATGGGMLLDDENRELIERGGRVICLMVEPEVVIRRLAGCADRPLLAQEDPLLAARRLLEGRLPLYRSFAWQVDTTDLTAEEVVGKVLQQWQARRRVVRTSSGETPIYIEEGVLNHLGRLVSSVCGNRTLALVSNPTVWEMWGQQARYSLEEAGFPVSRCLIPDGEEHKTLETVRCLYDAFLAAGLDRGSAIVALGGGVVGDVAGFAAATFLRGLPVVQVPTSLLAMVDSSVGGKTGVDLPQGKNLVGAFHPPVLVVIDPLVLGTLSSQQVRCGMAEVVKAGILADPDLFAMVQAGPPWPWIDLLDRSLAVKIDVVQEDPGETGRRAVLNLGHTAGHALERLSDYALPHGEAVAIGLVVASHIAAELGVCDQDLPGRVIQALVQLGLPVDWSLPCRPEDVLGAMAHDKKRRAGRQKWILPRGIGDVVITDGVPEDLVLSALARTQRGKGPA